MECEQKYKIGESVMVNTWVGVEGPFEILEIEQTYHHRLGEYCWGYFLDGKTSLTMEFIPEGYLRKLKPISELKTN